MQLKELFILNTQLGSSIKKNGAFFFSFYRLIVCPFICKVSEIKLDIDFMIIVTTTSPQHPLNRLHHNFCLILATISTKQKVD